MNATKTRPKKPSRPGQPIVSASVDEDTFTRIRFLARTCGCSISEIVRIGVVAAVDELESSLFAAQERLALMDEIEAAAIEEDGELQLLGVTPDNVNQEEDEVP